MTATPMTDRANGSTHPAPERGHVALAALWFGIFGGPLAWSLQTLINLTVSAHACFPHLWPLTSPVSNASGITFVVSLAALGVCIAATFVAVRSWMRTRGEQHGASGRASENSAGTSLIETGEGRTRFMALAGVLASLLFLAASLIHTASIFLVGPCAFGR